MAAVVQKARAAQSGWAALPVRRRADVARRMAREIAREADEISEVISRATGKTRLDALSTEVLPAAIAARYYARIAPRLMARKRVRRSSILFFSKVSWVEQAPFGVVGIISPWNYPFGIPMHEVTAALLGGNAVLLKVATMAEPVGRVIERVARAADLPEGLLSLVPLPGERAGDAMLAAGIDRLCFTGSTEVGRQLMVRAGARLIPVSLELGGNDPMIVLEDANLERAAAGALWAGVSNAGQSCAGVERIYVAEPVYQRFRDLLADGIRRLRVGPDRDFSVDVGTLSNEEQMEKMKELLADAESKGAVVTARSETKPAGLCHPALLLERGEDSMRILREEIFGPLLVLRPVKDEREAVERANDSRLGLTASVWSADRRRARRVASQLAAGTVTINDHLMSHGMAETPWGGFKDSGIGRTHGAAGLLAMSQTRAVVDERLHRAPRNLWWYPHDRKVYDGLRAALDLVFGRGIGARLKALPRAAGLILRMFRRSG